MKKYLESSNVFLQVYRNFNTGEKNIDKHNIAVMPLTLLRIHFGFSNNICKS